MSRKLLVTGSGAAAMRHIALASASFPELEIAMWRRSPAKNSLITHVREVFTEDEVLKFKPDLAVIASPATLHLNQANFLTKLGTHILVEKPLSVSSVGASSFFDSAAEARTYVQVGYNLRFSEGLDRLWQLINTGKLGKLQAVDISVDQYLPDWRPGVDYKTSVSAQNSLGGGALLELSHEIDYAIRLFGSFSINHAFLGQISDLEIDVEDTVEIHGELQDRQNNNPRLRIHLGMVNRAPRRHCEVSGTEASARWDGIRGTLEIFDPNTNKWEVAFADPEDLQSTYERQLFHFFESARSPFNAEKHYATKTHELRVLSTIDEIRTKGLAFAEKAGN